MFIQKPPVDGLIALRLLAASIAELAISQGYRQDIDIEQQGLRAPWSPPSPGCSFGPSPLIVPGDRFPDAPLVGSLPRHHRGMWAELAEIFGDVVQQEEFGWGYAICPLQRQPPIALMQIVLESRTPLLGQRLQS